MDVQLKDLGGRGCFGGFFERRQRGGADTVHDAEVGGSLRRGEGAAWIEDLERADRRQDGGDAEPLSHEFR